MDLKLLAADHEGKIDEQTIKHLLELQRFAEIGRLSASMLHEISNPLTAAIIHLDPSCGGTSQNIKYARQNIRILQKYVDAARQQVQLRSTARLFSVRSQLEQIRRILEPHALRHRVKLHLTLLENLRIYGDAVKFQQMIANLIKNAIDSYATLPHDHAGRSVEVTIEPLKEQVRISVTDHGLGMSPDELKQIFNPFYTTKVRAGHGLGIGLTIVKQFVEQDFGGTITATSKYGRGTCFTVELPVNRRP